MIELLVVISVIAVLAALLLPALRRRKRPPNSPPAKRAPYRHRTWALCGRVCKVSIGIRVDKWRAHHAGFAMESDASAILRWQFEPPSCPSEPVPFSHGPYRIIIITIFWEQKFCGLTLGLGLLGEANMAVPESRVLVPSDMIAIGELVGSGFPAVFPWYDLHGRGFNAVFCDAHADSSNPKLIPQQWNINGWIDFKPDAARAKRMEQRQPAAPGDWPNP